MTKDTTPTFIGIVNDDSQLVVPDQFGDFLTAAPGQYEQPDIIAMTAVLTEEAGVSYVDFGLRFANEVTLASSGRLDAVSGYIDIDVDGAARTGSGWLIDVDGNFIFDVSEDANGNGVLDIVLGEDRNNNGLLDSAGEGLFTFGRYGDEPVVGVWTADPDPIRPPGPIYRIGLFRRTSSGGTWYLDLDGNGVLDATDRVVTGPAGTVRLVGDWASAGGPLGYDSVGVFGPGWSIDPAFDPNDVVFVLDVVRNAVLDPTTEGFVWIENAADPAAYLPVVGKFAPGRGDLFGTYNTSERTWLLDTNGDRIPNELPITTFRPPLDPGVHELPVVGDWNRDGVEEIGLFYQETGQWYLDLNGDMFYSAGEGPFLFGEPGGQPVIGDWNGDGFVNDLGTVFVREPERGTIGLRELLVYLDLNGNRVEDDVGQPVVVGQAGEDLDGDGNLDPNEDINQDGVLTAPDQFVAGDWNGSGRWTVGIFRPNDASHVSTYGPRTEDLNGNNVLDPGEDLNGNGVIDLIPTSGLGFDYYIDLGSESEGLAALRDATTGAKVADVRVQLFPDQRTLQVR
ncbi:MAG TPA: hypothetical protein EYP14_02425, partial [Planctomycetaceae bacterium]|nr:hypothetical protein [Planctomycetaceae bacterium]